MFDWINFCWEQQKREDVDGGEWCLRFTARPWRSGVCVCSAQSSSDTRLSSTVVVGRSGWCWGGNPETETDCGSNPAELQELPGVLEEVAGVRLEAADGL